MKKLLMLLLSVVLAFSAVACNGPGSNGNDDTISYFDLVSPDNGFGTEGLKELVLRFEKEYKDHSFAEDKVGVDAELTTVQGTLNITNMAKEPYHAYISPYSASRSMISGGDFLNVDDFMHKTIDDGTGKSLHDKLPEAYRASLQAPDGDNKGEYYFVPGLTYYGGLSYDKHMFDAEGFYFVAPGQEADASYFMSGVLSKEYYFAEPNSKAYQDAITTPARDSWDNWNANKYLSCGPDGEYGTYDDGMASSLEEFIVLCEKIKDVVPPFIVSGQYKGNMMPGTDAMICALLGEENGNAMQNFTSDSFEIVVGYKQGTQLWGMSDVMEPITTTVKVTESQGYYTTWSAARYYVTAFMKLATEKGWFGDSINKTSINHEGAENLLFVNDYKDGQYQGAILFESSYWMNETQESTNYQYFNTGGYVDEDGEAMTSLEREKEIKWLSLPRQLTGSVSEGNGTKEIFMHNGTGQKNLFNSVYKDDPEALALIEAWILFLYRDENIKYLTATTGCTYVFDYEKGANTSAYDEEPFYRDVFTRVANGTEIKLVADNPTFLKDQERFTSHYWDSYWTGLGSERKTTLYTAFDPKGNENYSIYEAFKGDAGYPLLLDRAGWARYFQTSGDSNDMPPTYATDADGNEIVYKAP